MARGLRLPRHTPMVTTITKTIKPSGGDYATPQDAWNNIRTIVGSTDLPTADTAVVFEMYRGEYASFTAATSNGYTLDATRNVTFRAAPGEGHGGKTHGGVRIASASAGPGVTIQESFVDLDGLTIIARNGAASDYGVWLTNAYGCTIQNCVILADGNYSVLAQANTTGVAATTTLRNILAIGDGVSNDRYIDLRGTSGAGGEVTYVVANCSAFDAQYFVRAGTSGDATATCNVKLVNNFAGNCDRAYQTSGAGTLNVTGSNNIGPSTQAFPAAVQASSQTWDITTDTRAASDGNTAIYDSGTYRLTDAEGNDAIHVGVSPSDDSDVPATDIVGKSRGITTTNVGAFQRLKHIWTDIMATSRESVDVSGVLRIGAGYCNAKVTTLTCTGPSDTDDTPVIPEGTSALWIQHIDAEAGTDLDETCTFAVHIDGSTSFDLLSFGYVSIPTANAKSGYYQMPVEVTGTDGTYPFLRASNAAAVDSSEVHKFRVIAIGDQGPSWS